MTTGDHTRFGRMEIDRLLANEEPLRDLDLTGADLSRLDLSKQDLSGADLSSVNLSHANLSDTNLSRANLQEAVLYGACLRGADLVAADARGATFSECDASQACFGGTLLDRASFFEATLAGASFSQARMSGVDLRCANLKGARLHSCDLHDVDASNADLRGAEFDHSQVYGAIFDGADLREARLKGIVDFKHASFIDADIRDTDFRGAYSVRRQILDENYLHEFRSQSRRAGWLYKLWWVTSDCGRSFWRWGLWTGLVVALFAFAFEFVAIDYGDHRTPLSSLYYSVITLTTLGYGDVLPASMPAQALAMIEVIVGYVALGGLISILGNRMARRGE